MPAPTSLARPLVLALLAQTGASQSLENPILFCTQVPNPSNYLTITSTFGNHRAKPNSVVRGGDLMIRYPDGSLRNLTREAGYGEPGFVQTWNAIAVREPCVHWDGTRALFSMVVGAPPAGSDPDLRWQVYEVSGLGQGQAVSIYRVPSQPPLYNNVSPFYLSNGRVGFTSDRPRNGAPHLYPQLDEYEEAPTNTGIWSLDPFTGDLDLLTHNPSGAFRPTLDSSGRVIYTRWDHLERDQQTDLELMGAGIYGTFNYTDESAGAWDSGSNFEWFPEPRSQWIGFVNQNAGYTGPLNGYQSHLVGNDFNEFLPWQVFQDGTHEETVNHVGRHELFASFQRARNDDANLTNFGQFAPWVVNDHAIGSLHQIREDPLVPGLYYAVDCRRFDTHAAGQVVSFYAPAGAGGHEVDVTWLTHRETADPTLTPGPNHTGLYRSPLRTVSGVPLAVHTPTTAKDHDQGGWFAGFYWPISTYDFRIKRLDFDGQHWRAGASITGGGVPRVVVWADPWQWRAWYGTLWELDPVEVVARPTPPVTGAPAVETPELAALAPTGVSPTQLRNYLIANDLALMVVRDATTRDGGDLQQPYNLRVAGSGHQTTGASVAALWDVSHLQLFQADQLRSLNYGGSTPLLGRRPLAWPMHDAPLPGDPTAPQGGIRLASDGSAAALVPARRAMSWQLTAPNHESIVRERYWVTFQAGEIRTCNGCHGVNDRDQAGDPADTTPPQALTALVQWLQNLGQL